MRPEMSYEEWVFVWLILDSRPVIWPDELRELCLHVVHTPKGGYQPEFS